MSNQHDQIETLEEIRSIMERSSRFISLSGLSGVSVGIMALIGVALGYFILDLNPFGKAYYVEAIDIYSGEFRFFLLDAIGVLGTAIGLGILFTTRRAKKKGLSVWDNTAKRMLINLMIPLAAGGAFCLILLHYGLIFLVAPVTLIFYGLALLNASKYTLNDIRFLGIIEIIIGLIAAIWYEYSLLLWSVGFGILHILYGISMYYKYEK